MFILSPFCDGRKNLWRGGLRYSPSVVVKEKVPKMGKKMTHPILGQNSRWIS